MPAATRRANNAKSKTRSRVEHFFAEQKVRMGLFVRTIGIARAKTKIGMANLIYNLRRLAHAGRAGIGHVREAMIPPLAPIQNEQADCPAARAAQEVLDAARPDFKKEFFEPSSLCRTQCHCERRYGHRIMTKGAPGSAFRLIVSQPAIQTCRGDHVGRGRLACAQGDHGARRASQLASYRDVHAHQDRRACDRGGCDADRVFP